MNGYIFIHTYFNSKNLHPLVFVTIISTFNGFLMTLINAFMTLNPVWKPRANVASKIKVKSFTNKLSSFLSFLWNLI